MKKVVIFLAVVAFLMLCYAGFRFMFCPKPGAELDVTVPPETKTRIGDKLASELISVETLATRVSGKGVLLVGENHFKKEIIEYFLLLLEKIDAPRIVLNLELPDSEQENIDRYFQTGDASYVKELNQKDDCLPFGRILEWAYANRHRVKRVYAMDENQWRIFAMRACCTDTRNETMALKILETRGEFPDALVVAYGGQLHMIKSGRYMYDHESRKPVGKRLIEQGIPENEISSIMLDGNDKFPLSEAWRGKIGAMEMTGVFGELPHEYFTGSPVYGVVKARELFNYYVNVGNVTSLR